MQKKRIQLSISSPVLRQAVEEQIMLLPGLEVVADGSADAVVTDTPEKSVADTPHVILSQRQIAAPENGSVIALPVRIGAVMDQLRYLLSGRIRHVARGADPLNLGQFLLHTEDSALEHRDSGTIIRLTDKERVFLETLYAAPDHVLDRKTLLVNVWGYAEGVETHTLETHLYRLRQKLESTGAEGLIQSGDGLYRLKI